MTTQIRRLNDRGLKIFSDYIASIAGGEKTDPPLAILMDDSCTEAVDFTVEIEDRVFNTRFDIGVHLKERLAGINPQHLLGDTGIWSWMALFWFNQLCPAKADGSRNPSKPYNYILSPNYNHQPRHALQTTWVLVDRYDETARFLLSKKPNERGELMEQIAARQFFISCRGIIEAANRLYYDPESKTFKRGSTTQTRKGNIRRFIGYLQQLELTYDLYTLPKEEIIRMLPTEYSAFLSSDATS